MCRSPSQFDHVITGGPMNNDLIWVDTTTEVAPFRLLSANLPQQKSFAHAVSGAGKTGKTPTAIPFPSSQGAERRRQGERFWKANAKDPLSFSGDVEL